MTDKIEGSCYTWFLSNNSFDAAFNAVAYKANGSFTVHMKNPLKMFYLDDTYTYEGQVSEYVENYNHAGNQPFGVKHDKRILPLFPVNCR